MKWLLILSLLFTTYDLHASACRSYFYFGKDPLFISYLQKRSEVSQKYSSVESLIGKKVGALELVAFFDTISGQDSIIYELLKNEVTLKRGKLSKRLFIRKITALSKNNKIRNEAQVEKYLQDIYGFILKLNLRLSTLPWKSSPHSYQKSVSEVYKKAEVDFYNILNQIRETPNNNPILAERDSRVKAKLFKYVWYAFIALPFLPLDAIFTSDSISSFLNSPAFMAGSIGIGLFGNRYNPLTERFYNQYAFERYLKTGVIFDPYQFHNNLKHKWFQDQFFRILMLGVAYSFIPDTLVNLSHIKNSLQENIALANAITHADFSHIRDEKMIFELEQSDYQIYVQLVQNMKAQKSLTEDQKDELKAYESEIRRIEKKMKEAGL